MKVRAIQTGYYQHKRRKAGEAFTLVPVKGRDKDGKPIVISVEQQFSKRWMEPFKGKVAKAAPVVEEADEAEEESEELDKDSEEVI